MELRAAIEASRSLSINFDELPPEEEHFDDSKISEWIAVLENLNPKAKGKGLWCTCQRGVTYLVHALRPFTKNFLVIAREGAAVTFSRLTANDFRFHC